MTVTYIGFLNCTKCKDVTYISRPEDIKIWAHPDDELPLIEAKCSKCKHKIETRLSWEHVVNFRKRGCKVLTFNEKFTAFTDKDIDEFEENFDAELERLFEAV